MKRILFWLVVSGCMLGAATAKYPDFLTRLVHNFQILQQARMQEKTWLHTDRTCYSAGDTIRFRAFLVNASTHQRSSYSRFVYVDLVNRRDSVLQKVKLALHDFVFSGYISLPEDIQQGEYFLRTYSYWMQNIGEDYICKRKIRVINPTDSRVLVGVTYREEKGKKYAVVQLANSRKEPYQKVSVDYQLINQDQKGRIHQKRTDEEGKIQIQLEGETKPSDIWVRFTNSVPYEFSRYVHLPQDTLDYDVAFFPEGGDLIPGVKQTIAFKAIGEDGLSVDVHGFLYSDADSIVDIVQSIHKGMGWLNNQLEAGKQYYVVVKSSQGLEKKFFLPEWKEEGIGLTVRQTDTVLMYNVIKGEKAVLPDSLYLIAHMRGQLLIATPLEERLKGILYTGEFPEGILHLCIMDPKGHIYSQRLCFIRHTKRPAIQIKPDKKAYESRELVDLELTLSGDTTREGRFSFSITDDATVDYDSLQQGNIVSELLLNSDLKGYIEDPGFYFRNVTRGTDRLLDLLLLTQGWTRFDVSAVAAGHFDESEYYMEKGQALSGQVKNFWGKEAQNAQLMLISTNKNLNILYTDTTGHFLVEDITFPENTLFIVQAKSSKGRKRVELIIDSERYLPPKIRIPYERQQANGEDEFYQKYGRDYYYDQGIKVYVLDEAVVKRSVPKKQYSFYDHAARYTLDSAFLADTKIRDMRTLLTMQFPGVMVEGENITYHGKPLYLLLNDFEETFDRIMMMDPQQFLSISFLEEAMSLMYFGSNGGNGALVFTENFNYMRGAKKSMNLSAFIPLGYQRPIDFYIPRYDVDSVRIALADTVDLRSTLYWNPNVRIKASEPTHVQFFMDDGCDRCTFILEGVLKDGTVCREKRKIKLRD